MLDERRILDEDLRAAISQAEKTGQKLVNPENGRFKAAAQPFKAVFWVEYSPAGDGYEVHNAYSHRMTVAAGGRI